MKQTRKKIVVLMVFMGISFNQVFAKPFAKGPYLGQTPPGPIPKVFAPGLICDTRPHQLELWGSFSADGNTFCFNRRRYVYINNPQWIADISSAGAQQTGEADLPWGRQWTERTPWLYPLENMVLWGLGLPLGVAAWLGVGLVVVQLIVRAWKNKRGNSEVPDADPSAVNHPSSVVESPSSTVHRPSSSVDSPSSAVASP